MLRKHLKLRSAAEFVKRIHGVFRHFELVVRILLLDVQRWNAPPIFQRFCRYERGFQSAAEFAHRRHAEAGACDAIQLHPQRFAVQRKIVRMTGCRRDPALDSGRFTIT